MTLRRAVVVVLVLAGCGSSTPAAAPADCQLEVLAHLDPLPPADNPFAFRYTEVAARDGIAYLGMAQGEGVQVLDVATGTSLGVLDKGVGTEINSVALEGNLLAVAPSSSGLVVYDVSDPRAPGRRRRVGTPARNCHTVFIHQDIVYCSTASTMPPHLVLYRVTTPSDPAAPLDVAPVGTYSAPVAAGEPGEVLVHDVFVHERDGRRLAYLAYWERGMQIVDVTDPAAPHLVGASAPTPGRWTHSVWVEGSLAYVGEESYKGPVTVYDVSDPSAPREVGRLRSTEGDAVSAHNVQVAGGFVYASWYQDGLRVFPAGDPAAAEVARFHTWNGGDNRNDPGPFDVRYNGDWDVFVDGDGRIFAADIQTGLWVLRHHPADTDKGCPADRPRGTSAFAKTGRPPFGFGAREPKRLRPGRTFPVFIEVISVDPSFDVTDDVTSTLQVHLEVTGAELLSPLAVLPTAGPSSMRLLRATARVSATPPPLELAAQLSDEGSARRTSSPIQVLEPATNQDLEPNEDPWTSGMLVLDAGAARVSGTVAPNDDRDLYLLERPPTGSGLRVRLLGYGTAARPAPTLTVSREPFGGQSFDAPAAADRSEGDFRSEQVVLVPAGEPGPLWIAVSGAPGGLTSYQLDVTTS
jgi:hypothetical protein